MIGNDEVKVNNYNLIINRRMSDWTEASWELLTSNMTENYNEGDLENFTQILID